MVLMTVSNLKSNNQNRKCIKSVGIDIGSSTFHLVFSNLHLKERENYDFNLGREIKSPKYDISEREISYISNITLTSYKDPETIDVQRLSETLNGFYDEAGLTPEDIIAGAVIITGEAAKKQNAENILSLFAEESGKFVCATAGPRFEAILAAHGSGAVSISRRKGAIMNIDLGGGTTKIAIVESGSVVEVACINIGARLVAVDDSGIIVRLEDAARIIAADLGFDLRMGEKLTFEQRVQLVDRMVECLFEVINRSELSPLTKRLMITSPLTYEENTSSMFSGGVSEYIYGYEKRDFGDLGRELGDSVVEFLDTNPASCLLKPDQRIRATVIGASHYTLQVSGNTILISEHELLPLRNIQVISPYISQGVITVEKVTEAVHRAFQKYGLEQGESIVALSFRQVHLDPSNYDLMKTFAHGITKALKKTIEMKIPIVLVFGTDIGRTIGNMVIGLANKDIDRGVIDCDVISIDEVDLKDLDFIDIGGKLDGGEFVPVVVKSLIFHKR